MNSTSRHSPWFRVAVGILAAGVLFALFGLVRSGNAPSRGDDPGAPGMPLAPLTSTLQSRKAKEPATSAARQVAAESPSAAAVSEPSAVVNKADRLAQIRESFRALSRGDPTTALRAARELRDDTERETALMELVTQWQKGLLTNPRERAQAIAEYGLEAGWGCELAKDPHLALLWADELTEGPGRTIVLERAAVTMAESDPGAAFALSGQLDPTERRAFSDAVFAGWAEKDTDAALQYANQLPDAGERDAATQAIRSVAPVGIGTALAVQDGYAVVKTLIPGAAAELSGQLNPGDRILAIAQGDNTFVDAKGLPLKDLVDMIRGAAGTSVQLQVLPAAAEEGSTPRTVSIVRSQLKFKQPK